MDPVDQFAFVVGLAELHLEAQPGSGAAAQGGNVGEGFMAVGGGLTGAEHIEVRAVENQDGASHYSDISIVVLAPAGNPERDDNENVLTS
ncbi:hypothetical protein D3C78_1395240 [compost metagenome]